MESSTESNGTIAYLGWVSTSFYTGNAKPGILVVSQNRLKFISEVGEVVFDYEPSNYIKISSVFTGSIHIKTPDNKYWIMLYPPVSANEHSLTIDELERKHSLTIKRVNPKSSSGKIFKKTADALSFINLLTGRPKLYASYDMQPSFDADKVILSMMEVLKKSGYLIKYPKRVNVLYMVLAVILFMVALTYLMKKFI